MASRGGETPTVVLFNRFGSLALMCFALFVAGLGTKSLIHDWTLHEHGVTAVATVLAERQEKTPKGTTRTTFEIGFALPDGTPRQAWIGELDDGQIGQTLVILYNPADPGDAQPKDSMSGTWWGEAALEWFSALAFGCFAVLIWRHPHRPRGLGEPL